MPWVPFSDGFISGKVMQLQQVFISELFWYPAASRGGESLSFVAFLSWTWGIFSKESCYPPEVQQRVFPSKMDGCEDDPFLLGLGNFSKVSC